MGNVLRERGFEIIECIGPNATRDGILGAWKNLISATTAGDTVLIYYTGHGGLVRPEEKNRDPYSTEQPQQYQFLVPMDYSETSDTDFRGILNVEISYMLRNTTDKTRNVTIILDCCHSGRFFRVPGQIETRARNLPEIKYHVIASFLARLQREGHFPGDLYENGNPYAVRISASARDEVAVEYPNSKGEWGGALTDALIRAMGVVKDYEVSWRTILFHVSRLISIKSLTQHPRVEGPGTRALFSLQHVMSAALYVSLVDNSYILHGGSVVGVSKGNIYSVIPFDLEESDIAEQLPEAQVTAVYGLKAQANMTSPPSWKSFKHQGALAFLKQEMFCRLPINSPSGLKGLEEAISRSKYVQRSTSKESVALELDSELGLVSLLHRGVRIASQPIENAQEAPSRSFSDILMDAERLARAQRVLGLRCERKEERLKHYVDIQVGIVENGKPSKIFQLNDDDHVKEGERVYILLENKGSTPVHASVFNINIAGYVSLITTEDPLGITLFPDDFPEILGADAFGDLRGLKMSWPDNVSKNAPIEEWLFIVLSGSPVDLRYLCDSVDRDLALSLARNTEKQSAKSLDIRYDTILIPFKLHPLTTESATTPGQPGMSRLYMHVEGAMEEQQPAVSAAELHEPESVPELSGTPAYPPSVIPKVRVARTTCLYVLLCSHWIIGHPRRNSPFQYPALRVGREPT
jgi:hypothetical protein